MPRAHELDPIVSTATRICPACGKGLMRIITAKPAEHYMNLAECQYRCTCGEEAIHMVLWPVSDGASTSGEAA